MLVTGVGRWLGAHVARSLAAQPAVTRVIGVDATPPHPELRPTPTGVELAGVEFIRADIRNPLIGKVITGGGVDTVVHMNVRARPADAGGRSAMKEMNVIGTMQLLAACQNSGQVRRLVVKSTTAVYGSSARDPALFTEDMEPRSHPSSGYAKDAAEIEGYVRGFARRRPDVDVSVLRFANFIGPGMDSAMGEYFALPVVPTVLGFDPRLQLLHQDDALEVLVRAATTGAPAVLNVAGSGVLRLSQAIRRAGRIGLPVPGPAAVLADQVIRRSRALDYTVEQRRFLHHGRVVDTTRLREQFGYQPRYTTLQAFDDFVRGRRLTPAHHRLRLPGLERLVPGLTTGPAVTRG